MVLVISRLNWNIANWTFLFQEHHLSRSNGGRTRRQGYRRAWLPVSLPVSLPACRPCWVTAPPRRAPPRRGRPERSRTAWGSRGRSRRRRGSGRVWLRPAHPRPVQLWPCTITTHTARGCRILEVPVLPQAARAPHWPPRDSSWWTRSWWPPRRTTKPSSPRPRTSWWAWGSRERLLPQQHSAQERRVLTPIRACPAPNYLDINASDSHWPQTDRIKRRLLTCWWWIQDFPEVGRRGASIYYLA